MNLLIQNGIIVHGQEGEHQKADILIRGGVIVEVGDMIPSSQADEIHDAENRYILPGLVDAHCHLREPGFEYKEDIETGSISAAFGGFTAIACMPNTDPVVDNKIVLHYILNRAKEIGLVKVLPIAAVTVGQNGEILTDMGMLAENGAVGFSDDGKPVKNAAIMKKAMEMATMYERPVISHCEDPDLARVGVMNEGLHSLSMGLRGIPAVAEDIMVSRELILAEYTQTPIHIAHVSTRGSVELIRQAKMRNVKVTAETCPHYFSITEETCADYNTLGRVNPPLRTQDDVEAIIAGLIDGTIDIIATDHAPHHQDEKDIEFEKAANGLVGFETALPLAITNLVRPGHLTLSDLVNKMSTNPARLFKIHGGEIRVGAPADLIVVDTEYHRIFDPKDLHSKSKNSPYGGMSMFGAVLTTIVDGKFVVRNQALVERMKY